MFINQGCTFLGYPGIGFGERVIGRKTTFITTGHPVDRAERRLYKVGSASTWRRTCGSGATILPGVIIGFDAVIAAGTIISDDVSAASLVRGTKAGVRRRW